MKGGIRPGVTLHLSDDGVQLRQRVVVWSEGAKVGTYWVHVFATPNAATVELVRVRHIREAPHPIVKIIEEQP